MWPRLPETLGTVVAGYSGHWLGHNILLLGFPCFPFDLSMKRAREQVMKRSHLTTSGCGGEQEWQEKPVLFLLDALAVGRNHHVYVLFLLPTISDPAS